MKYPIPKVKITICWYKHPVKFYKEWKAKRIFERLLVFEMEQRLYNPVRKEVMLEYLTNGTCVIDESYLTK